MEYETPQMLQIELQWYGGITSCIAQTENCDQIAGGGVIVLPVGPGEDVGRGSQ
jgi:hypothetical protein